MNSLYRLVADNQFLKRLLRTLLPAGVVKVLSRKAAVGATRIFFDNHAYVIGPSKDYAKGLVPVVYWDGEPNFGDMIGPYLISKITGKPVLNILDTSMSGYMTVGSILHFVNKKNMLIWGSGFIETPTEQHIDNIKKFKPDFLSVRGQETARQLERAGLTPPDSQAQGDPALLMPLFYTPATTQRLHSIGLCPHFVHKADFFTAFSDQDEIKIIDVQRNPQQVIDELYASAVCISTSLHGLIVAQAYAIPWVWLEIVDHNLRGNDFKFKDFFSTLEATQIAHVQVARHELATLDIKNIATRACVPNKKYDESKMLAVIQQNLEKQGYLANTL